MDKSESKYKKEQRKKTVSIARYCRKDWFMFLQSTVLGVDVFRSFFFSYRVLICVCEIMIKQRFWIVHGCFILPSNPLKSLLAINWHRHQLCADAAATAAAGAPMEFSYVFHHPDAYHSHFLMHIYRSSEEFNGSLQQERTQSYQICSYLWQHLSLSQSSIPFLFICIFRPSQNIRT